MDELGSYCSTTSNTNLEFQIAFDNGRMNQRIWSGLTVTFMTTAFSTATSGLAQQAQAVDQGSEGSPATAQVRNVTPTVTSASAQPRVSPPEVVKVGEFHSQEARAAQEEVIAKIHAYRLDGRQAATLYVRSIPVLTFLGSGSLTASGTKMGEATGHQTTASRHSVSTDAAPRSRQPNETTRPSVASEAQEIENDPVWRATAVAARLNQLSRDNVDAKAITVRWNPQCNCYSIEVKGEELVRINGKTILPDTTGNLANDALQATNRLRRLMGDAPPLREIAGIPPARPVLPVAKVSLGPIRLQIRGVASWYGPGFHGRRSASGERYNQNAMTAAHRSLPFGTSVQVTNLNNGRSVVVRINDRGPYIRGRVIDLSAAAARMLGLMRSGTAPVNIQVLEPPQREVAGN